jgi:peptidoglycan/xylan/chitin deacetylase (PgdA/CDA1 family)
MRDRLRKAAKKLAYRGGALSLRHVVEHADTLTVVMFHRVLDRADPRWAEANPADTVSAAFFADCLRFFRRHYAVVALADVMRAAGGGGGLPRRALLITFDDGWSDNLRYAAPLLREHGLPAVVFVAVEAVAAAEPEWWQERVYGAFRTGAIGAEGRARLAAAAAAAVPGGACIDRPGEPEVLALIARLSQVDPDRRTALIAGLPPREAGARMMLTAAELPRLRAAGVEIGVHGYSHAPLTMLADPAGDLARARDGLRALADGHGEPDALAIPHGRFDEDVIAAAQRIGYKLVFTSRPHINRLAPGRRPAGRVLGRIVVEQGPLSDPRGRLNSEEMATWLFLRPMQ